VSTQSRRATRSAVPLILVLTLLATGQEKPRFATDSEEQQKALALAMRQNCYTLSLANGKLEGPGMEFLAQNVRNAQFVVFGEEHSVKEFPQFLAALFSVLHKQDDYNYLALESDPVSAHLASWPPLRGDLEALSRYAARYPNAFTFPTDQELEMMAKVGRISGGRADPIWGLDQSFGVLHGLDRLRVLPGFHSTPKFEELHEQAEKLDRTRPGNGRDFMETVNLADLQELRRQMDPPEGSEAAFILDNLISSSRIYGHYFQNERYANGSEREEQMKRLFLRLYRTAEIAGEPRPKVLAKLGHWHVFRGLGPSHLQTLGNFLTEFATANGMQSFTLGVYLRGQWRDVAQQQGLEPIALATDPLAWTIIDFRALRPAITAGRFGTLDANLLMHIYGFDAALVLGSASEGTYTRLTGSPPSAK
jgi:hypothetical protein